VDEPAREDPVERRLGRKRPVEERGVLAGLRQRDERLSTPGRPEERRVDARWRCEARPRHAPDEAQLVPRSPCTAEHRRGPDRGALRGEPPLHDRVELRELHARIAEEAPQDCRADGERQVRDDRERLVRQRDDDRVALQHLDAGVAAEARCELPERSSVELDRAHPGARIRERACQDAGAGTEVVYAITIDTKMPLLGMMKRRAEKVILDTALKELKKRVEG
jgi:hypothetical protein